MLKFRNDYFVRRDEIAKACPDKLMELIDIEILSKPGITLDDEIYKYCFGKVPDCAKEKYYNAHTLDKLCENKLIECILLTGNVELEDFVEIMSSYEFVDGDGKKVTLSDIAILPYGETCDSDDDPCYVDITEINKIFNDILDIRPIGYRIRVICQCDYIWRLIDIRDFIRHVKDTFYSNDTTFDVIEGEYDELLGKLYIDIQSKRIDLSKIQGGLIL